jgi:uncharacterized protein with GYD domain
MIPEALGGVLRGRNDLVERVQQGSVNMAKYLFEARFTAEGAKGIAREGGSARRATIAKMIESLGGKLETFYFAFGDVDVYTIVDIPDSVTATAIALAVNQSGAVAMRTVVLISPEEMDKASKKAVDYRPPGR